MPHAPHRVHNAENQLVISPSESAIGYNDNKFHTFRIPFMLMERENHNVLQSILDTAKVAFAHNKPGSKTVVIACPEGSVEKVQWISDALKKAGITVKIDQHPGSKFIDIAVVKGTEFCCVDRRTEDKGTTKKLTQITHAGGPLVLHPALDKVHSIQPYRQTIIRALAFVSAKNAPVKRIDYPFGSDGAPGVGFYEFLAKQDPVVARIFREQLHSPEQVMTMLMAIREELRDILAKNCKITATVINPQERRKTYDFDSRWDRRNLFNRKDLAL